MGEDQGVLFRTSFNRSIRVEASRPPLTEDAGVLVLREVADGLGLGGLVGTLIDHRVQEPITHPFR
jgi:hypothetical protein